MASILGWQQKWGVIAGTLTWADAWTEGFPLGDTTLTAVGHMTLAQSGFGYKITFPLGDLTLDMVGHSTLSANVTNVVPGDYALGNLQLAMTARTTLVGGPFNTTDPFWIDPPLTVGMTAHLGFQGVVNIATVLGHPLGHVTLPMVAHTGLSSPTLANTVSKDLGALTLNMIGGIDMTSDIIARTADAHPLGNVTLNMFGRTSMASSDLVSRLPPHPLGDISLAMTGRMTTSVITLFSGGPISLGALSLAMRGRMTPSCGISYPPFDTGSEMHAVVDPSVTPITAKVEPDGLSTQ